MFLIDSSFWEIKKTKDRGRGVFAKKDIEAGVVIGDYLGKVLTNQNANEIDDSKDFYLMSYHNRATIYPDPKKPGIHLLNHSCTPNCWMYTYCGHTLFFSLRHIFAGEELTVSYLLSPQDNTCAPCTHLCKCNGIICHQTMHQTHWMFEKWSAFHDKESTKTKRAKVHFGQELPKLPSYPETIADTSIYPLFGNSDKTPKNYSSTTLPPLTALREMIRSSGQTLRFDHLNLHILGIEEEKIIGKTLS